MSAKNVEDVYALTSLQRMMLLRTSSSADQTALVEQFSCTLIGKLDPAALRRAWDEVVRRHPVLRTGFAWQALKQQLQIVRRDIKVEWRLCDLSDQGESDRIPSCAEIQDADRQKGFDLTQPPLMRISLVRTSGDVHRLIWTVHHLVLDGWSLPLVLKEVFALYEAQRNESPSRFPSPRPFRDYIEWLSQQDMDAALDFWRARLDGFHSDGRLPMRSLEGQHSGQEYAEFETKLSVRPFIELQTLAAQQRITLAALLVAAWGFTLGRLQNHDEVSCDLAVSGRPSTLAGAETIVGPLMNNVPLRVTLRRQDTVANWLRSIQAELTELQQFEFTPCEQIYECCGLPSAGRRFESLFVYENYPIEKSRQIGVELEIRDACATTNSSFPLTVIVFPNSDLQLRLRYRRRCFSLANIERLATHFAASLANLIANPSRRLVDVSVCSERQRADLAGFASKPPPDEILERIPDKPLSHWLLEKLHAGPSLMWSVLDDWNHPAAVGVAGELCAARTGNEPDPADGPPSYLVASHEPHDGPTASQRMTRTGLLVRRLADGDWQWLGHACGSAVGDCRIDVRAVENQVRQHPSVADVTVRFPEETDNRASVIVYVVPAKHSKSLLDADGGSLLATQLRSALDHVIPLEILALDMVTLDQLPRLADGSTDLAALPVPRRTRPDSAPEYVAPRDEVETRLAEIWSDLLGVHPVGIHDNFMELGGDSALAISLIGRIEHEFQRKLPVVAMFSEPTVENLAELLHRPAPSSQETVLVPIRPQGDRRPLFCVHPAGGTVFCYLELARHLDPKQPVYGLQAVGIDGQQAPHNTVTQMAAHYVAAIRSQQTSGPYAICGWSSGGIVAYEVARQLETAGQPVSLLALFDAAIRSGEGEYSQEDVLAMLLMMFPGDTRQEVEALRNSSVTEQLAYFEQRAKSAQLILESTDQSQIRFIHDVFQANADAIASYRPQPYRGKVTLFRAAQAATPMHRDPLLGWGPLAREIEICEVSGDHVTMFREPTVGSVAALCSDTCDVAKVLDNSKRLHHS